MEATADEPALPSIYSTLIHMIKSLSGLLERAVVGAAGFILQKGDVLRMG